MSHSRLVIIRLLKSFVLEISVRRSEYTSILIVEMANVRWLRSPSNSVKLERPSLWWLGEVWSGKIGQLSGRRCALA